MASVMAAVVERTGGCHGLGGAEAAGNPLDTVWAPHSEDSLQGAPRWPACTISSRKLESGLSSVDGPGTEAESCF